MFFFLILRRNNYADLGETTLLLRVYRKACTMQERTRKKARACFYCNIDVTVNLLLYYESMYGDM